MKKGFYSIGSIIILLLAAVIFVLVPAMSERGSGKQLPDYGSFNGRHIRYEEIINEGWKITCITPNG